MGLDMSLYRVEKMKGKTLQDILELNERYYNEDISCEELIEIEKYLIQKQYGKTLLDEIMYWRKANAIHDWFVEYVQHGNDDCGNYEIHRETIEELYNITKQVYDSLKYKKRVTQVFKDYDGKPYEEDCYSPTDLSVASLLLPTQDGFYFGSVNYNEYYFKMVVETMNKCKEILDTFDFENNYLVYSSSW